MTPARSADTDNLTSPDGRPGADVTARLLLALTSLYVQRPIHTAEEQQQYVELALRLIDMAGPATRTAVAARLRRHPDAPAEVIERLGSLQRSHDAGSDHGPPHAMPDQQPACSPGFETDQCPAHGLPEPTPEISGDAGFTPGQPPSLTPEFGAAFFAASPAERRRLVSLLARRGEATATPERFHVRIDPTAWCGRTNAFAREFARLIDASESLSERILNDPSGEPMVIAARATGMPAAMLQRILLLVSPLTHHSVQRVYELTDLYHGLDGRAARDLLAFWRSESKPQPTGPDGASASTVANLRARFGALSARIQGQAVNSRSGRGSAAQRGLQSR